MTPLMPAPQPSTPQVPPAPGRGRSSPPSGEDSFALALEQGQAALHPASANPPAEQAMEDELPVEADVLAGAMPDQPALPLQPAPPWPPAGLAGLLLSAAGGKAGDAPAAMALPAAAVAAAAAAPATGPDADLLALAGAPAAGITAAGTDEEAGPAPTAFALPQLPSAPQVREAAPILAAPVPTPDVRAGDFSERFGAQLQWMAAEQIGHARIRVSPQELGPIEVVLRLDGERISADFISSHPETRQALEQGLPRLRDLLGEHGFQLAHADVGHQSSSSPDDGGAASGTEPDIEASGPSMTADDPAPTLTARGLLDAYA